MSAMNPKTKVQGHFFILATQMPASPNITAEMPTQKATIETLLLISLRPLFYLFESAKGETPTGVILVVLASSTLLSETATSESPRMLSVFKMRLKQKHMTRRPPKAAATLNVVVSTLDHF